MAKRNAPAKLTGGQGFNFEDQVAARFLLGLLGVSHPLGPDLGRLARIDWQAADAGWRVEDLALTFDTGYQERSVGVSIKSHKQVTESGFEATFTRSCWEQWLGIGTTRRLRKDLDLIALITGVLADGIHTAWSTLLGGAIELAAAPERLVARLQSSVPAGTGSLSSATQRALFDSVRCPSDLRAGVTGDDIAAAVLLRHVRLVRLDFGSIPSQALSDAIDSCQVSLRGSSGDARSLWESLVRIASRKRGCGGSIDLPELLSSLRSRFDLNDHSDYGSDWAEIARHSQERFQLVGLTVGGVGRLARRSARSAILRHLRDDRTCVVVGASGVGKSATVRRLGEGQYRLVWLTAELLQSGRETTFQVQLGLRHPFAQVIAASPTRCLVVFDGIDGLGEPGLKLVSRIIALLRANFPGRVRVALTVQPDGLTRLRAAFASAGVATDTWAIHTVRPPTGTEVDRLLGRFPGLASTALRPEFRSLLRNLKVFDWVVRLQEGGGLADDASLVTLTALIDRLWTHFVESDADGLARAALLKRTGAVEADRMIQGLPFSEVSAYELALLPPLETTGLVRRHDERILFVHDMFADWARLKYLVEQRLPDSVTVIRRAAVPGWFRAVRLYAQRLLEQPGGGIDAWQQAVQSLGASGAERSIVRDLFLEALVLANDSANLLTAAWPALISHDGDLLRILVDRFTYVGTVPDSRALAGFKQSEAAEFEHLFRLPLEMYWTGVLQILGDHSSDVIRWALAPTAKLLRLWLSTIVPVRRATKGLRNTASKLALTIAREIQACEAEGRCSVEKETRTDVYIALLWAVPEYPDEVAKLCLELANRRPEDEPIRLRREAALEANRRALERLPETNPRAARFLATQSSPEELLGAKRPPWPDGPSHRVDECFQEACMHWQASLPLAVNRPEAALEVLFAVLVQHPTYMNAGDSDYLLENLGLDDSRPSDPPFYYQGPFWTLLRAGTETAELGLTLIMRLVNFATERWQEHHDRLVAKYGEDASRGPWRVHVPSAGGWVTHPGDKEVLRWHDGWRSHPAVLSSMLMALEKWLYDEVDAGRPVDRWIERIVSEGKSAGLVGVLVQLGKYNPKLLDGPLRPLLGACEVYAMEHRLLPERSDLAFWSMDWQRYGEEAWNRVRDWHGLPHRKSALLNIALQFVLDNESVRTAVTGFYKQWEERLKAAPEDDALRGALNDFGVVVRCLKAEADGGEKLPEFHEWLKNRQQEALMAERKMNDDLLPLTLGSQCRKRLDECSPLTPEQLPAFFESLHSLAVRADSNEGGTRPAHAVVGGIAVLLILHRDWVREDPARDEWCREQLLSCLELTPGRRPVDFEYSAGEWDRDTFAAECGVAFLAESPSDPLARRLALTGLISFRYATVAATVRQAYRFRARLGIEFDRMISFAGEWSACRWSLRWSQEWQLDSQRLWGKICSPRLRSFESATTSPERRSLADIDAEGRDRTQSLFAIHRWKWKVRSESHTKRVMRVSGLSWLIRQCRRLLPAAPSQPEEQDDDIHPEPEYPSVRHGVPPWWPGVDTHYLNAGFAWLEVATKDDCIAEATVETLLDLLTVSLRTVPVAPKTNPRRRTRFPSKFDNWLFERIAAALPRIEAMRAKDLWKPILSLGGSAEFWVRHFLSDWFRMGAPRAVDPAEFIERWGSMLRFAIDAPDWLAGSHWHDAEQLVSELLGFRMGKALFSDDVRYASFIGRLLPEYERAAARWFGMSSVASAFCHFALKPFGADLLLPGIRWLAEAEPSWSEWAWNHDGLAEALVRVLRAALERHRHAIAGESRLRDGYYALCNKLVARGHHAALALRERVATSGGESIPQHL
jgi:hypothetical protein